MYNIIHLKVNIKLLYYIKNHNDLFQMIAFMVLNIISFICVGVATTLLAIVVAVFKGASSCAWNSYSQTCDCYINYKITSISGAFKDCNSLY